MTEIQHSPNGLSKETEQDQLRGNRSLIEIRAVAEAVGALVFNTINSRWLSPSDITQALTDAFAVVEASLEKLDEIRLTVVASQLMGNTEELHIEGTAGKAMVTRLPQLGINSLTLMRGLGREEFTNLVDILCENLDTLEEQGGFIKAFGEKKFVHVAVKRIQLKEVTEEEAVISRKDLEALSAEQMQKAESDVLDLLGGGASGGEAGDVASASMCEVAKDSNRMAELIVEAAEKTQDGAAGKDKKKMAGQVTECLRRAFDSLMDDPSSKTKKGKKAIAKTFRELEKEILAKMEIDAGGEDGKAVKGAINQMQETLKMDSIAEDYTKRLKALAESERHILRFIKSQGLENIRNKELEEKLNDGGLDVSGWHRLLARSSTASFGWDIEESMQETSNAVGRLALLEGRLEGDVESSEGKKVEKTPEAVVDDVTEVRHEMAASVEETEKKIQGLADAVADDFLMVEALEKAAKESGKGLKLTRRKLLEVLGEVVQEVCQPLSVINCSLTMVAGNSLGEITPAQADMLNLAAESTAKIKTLIDHLEQVAGLPSTLSPDQQIQDSLYGRE